MSPDLRSFPLFKPSPLFSQRPTPKRSCRRTAAPITLAPREITLAPRTITRSVVASLLMICVWSSPSHGDDLIRLPYNHPGLEVDLGVGLWAWPVPWDADGDGDHDLYVSCPDQPSNGIWFFENPGGGAEGGKFPTFKPAIKLSRTEHYVMPSYVDGNLRVLAPGVEFDNFTRTGTAARKQLPIPARFYQPSGTEPKGPKVRHNQWRYVDFDGNGTLDLVVGIEDWSFYGWDDAWDKQGRWTNGPLHGFVFWFANRASGPSPDYADPVKIEADGRPIDVYGCPSPNFVDFDGDGDLDLLCGEFLDGFSYFENVGTRTAPKYAAGRRLRTPDGRPLTMELQMIVPVAFDWDKDGDQDLIVGDEDGRVALVEHTGRLSPDRSPLFLPPRYFRQQADTLKCGALATPAVTDWDSDGDQDILCGNTAGFIEWFENLSGPKVEFPRWAAPRRLQVEGQTFRMLAGPNGSIQGPAEAKWGYTCLSVADWDHDGLTDLVTNDIWGKVRWMKNIGPKTNPELAPPRPIEVAWPGPPPKPSWTWWEPSDNELVTQWRTTPVAIDWTADGLVDLVMLDHEGYLVLFPRSKTADGTKLLPPRRAFFGDNVSVTDSRHKTISPAPGPLRLNNGTAGGSGRRKIAIADWDGDGKLDLLVNSTSANLLRQTTENAAKGSEPTDNQQNELPWQFHDAGPLVPQSVEGHSTSPTPCDFDGNGIVDLLIGAEDGRLYYLRNPSQNE
ncbi:MAG: hypothetical protein RI963_1241 [Planctomycetota bacterium]